MRHSNNTDRVNTNHGTTGSNQPSLDSTSLSSVEMDRMLDMNDLLLRLPFSRKIVLRMIHEQRIPAIYLNGKWVISRTQFIKVKEAGFLLPTGRVRRSK
jgi:hypothetical protein